MVGEDGGEGQGRTSGNGVTVSPLVKCLIKFRLLKNSSEVHISLVLKMVSFQLLKRSN